MGHGARHILMLRSMVRDKVFRFSEVIDYRPESLPEINTPHLKLWIAWNDSRGKLVVPEFVPMYDSRPFRIAGDTLDEIFPEILVSIISTQDTNIRLSLPSITGLAHFATELLPQVFQRALRAEGISASSG